jgi:hypothetical protein
VLGLRVKKMADLVCSMSLSVKFELRADGIVWFQGNAVVVCHMQKSLEVTACMVAKISLNSYTSLKL